MGFAAIYSLAGPSSAMSAEAVVVRAAANSVVNSVERSQALFGDKSVAISNLWALANQCAEAGWDGQGALSMNRSAIYNAVAFIRALPDGVLLPEIAPEPDGSVSLDWIKSRNRLFSMSVGSSNRLAYAWLDGTDKGHAVARFDEGRVPQRILDGISAIMATERDAAVRSR